MPDIARPGLPLEDAHSCRAELSAYAIARASAPDGAAEMIVGFFRKRLGDFLDALDRLFAQAERSLLELDPDEPAGK